MIGNRLYLLRKAAGLSQIELGNMLSVSHHTISSYEKEKSEPDSNYNAIKSRWRDSWKREELHHFKE